MRMFLASLGMLTIVGAVLGQVIELGDQFGIASEPGYAILTPATAMDSAGNFVVVWGATPSLPLERISARRYAADGSPVGDEFQVNTYTSGSQSSPVVAMDDTGGFFVVWVSDLEDGDDTSIQGRRFDSNGSALSDPFQINTYTTNRQSGPALSFDESGNSVVVWTSRDQGGCDDGIFGQRFEANGDPAGSEFQVTDCPEGDSRNGADVAMRSGGEFLVAWNGPGYGTDVFGRVFASDGSPAGAEFQINTYEYASQNSPTIGVTPSDEFLVVWNSFHLKLFPDGSVNAQFLDPSGGKIGAEFDIEPFSTDHTASPDLAMAPDGEFVVSWTQFDYFDFYKFNTEIFARRFDSGGSPLSEKFMVNNDTFYNQWHSKVAMAPNHQFVVVWRDQSYPGGFELVGQRYGDDPGIFSDGFESGDATAWAEVVP